jgi:transcriptional regulator with XRE-family HTH domain
MFIRESRIKKEISTEEMSILLGYEGYQAYYYKERGIRKLSVEDIAKIAVVLDVPIEKLFFETKVTEKVIKRLA